MHNLSIDEWEVSCNVILDKDTQKYEQEMSAVILKGLQYVEDLGDGTVSNPTFSTTAKTLQIKLIECWAS